MSFVEFTASESNLIEAVRLSHLVAAQVLVIQAFQPLAEIFR